MRVLAVMATGFVIFASGLLVGYLVGHEEAVVTNTVTVDEATIRGSTVSTTVTVPPTATGSAGPGGSSVVAQGTRFDPPAGWDSLAETVPVGTDWLPIAWASNVAFKPEDDPFDTGPNATLRSLPSNGIVLVAVGPHPSRSITDRRLKRRAFPLKIADGVWFPEGYEGQPARNVSFGYLDSRVDDQVLNVLFYFGANEPSRAMWAEADRVLATLSVE
jgi:hypothetical protein